MTAGRTHKRKWDLDDQGQTTKQAEETVASPAVEEEPQAENEKAEVIEKDELALAAVSEIAAKIKANIDAQSAPISGSSEQKDNHELHMVETKEEMTSPKNEPSLLESFGIKTDDEKAAKKPKLSEMTVLRKLDINDTRHRYYLCKASTQQEVENDFDVTIMTKGKYCPDRRLATEKDPALYLEIHGKTDEDVERAVEKLVEMIEKGPVIQATPQSSQTTTFCSEKVFIDIEPTEAVPVFTIRGKILGPQGSFLKHIQSQTGCKVHLRGKGSGYVELGSGEEVTDGLHLFISSLRKEEVEQAKILAEDLIRHVKKEADSTNATRAAATYPQAGSGYGYPPQQQPYYPNQYYPPMQPGAAYPYPNPYGSPPHTAYPQYPQYPQYPGYYPPPPGHNGPTVDNQDNQRNEKE